MISFDRVTKVYETKHGRNVILNDLTLDIPAKRGLAILGMNGAGKSTMVRMIAGTELPTSGRIKTEGRVSWPMGLSGTFQPSMTARDNVLFAAQIYEQDPDRVLAEVQEFSELRNYFHMPVGTFSNGMKSRLAFGLSLAVSFDIYLIDEIISVGDRLFKEKSHAALQQRVSDARVVLISHHEPTVREFCDRCAILGRGELRLFDDIDEAFHEFNAIKER